MIDHRRNQRHAVILAAIPLLLATFVLILEVTQPHPLWHPGNPSQQLYSPCSGSQSVESHLGVPRHLDASSGPLFAAPRLPSNAQLPVDAHSAEIPAQFCPPDGPLLAIVATTSDSLQQITQWMRYHQQLGFTYFYLFVEGPAARPDVVFELRKRRGVVVFEKDEALRLWHEHSRAWDETWLSAFFNKPCNAELFIKQTLNMEVALHQAKFQGVAWLAHIDTDELLRPSSTPDYSMLELVAALPSWADGVVFPNYEALPESANVTDPFVQTTLFKKAIQHVDKAKMQAEYKRVAHGNPNYFITYSNGKSMARVQPNMRPNGAHRWHNYKVPYREYTHPEAAVLHYTYNRFTDLINRRDRCDCAPTPADVQRCFFLDFDRQAFIASSLQTQAELAAFFRQRLVWDDGALVADLIKAGVLQRIYAPQVLLKANSAQRPADDKYRKREVQLRDIARRSQALLPDAKPDVVKDCVCDRFAALDSAVSVLDLTNLTALLQPGMHSDAALEQAPVYSFVRHFDETFDTSR